MSDFENQMIPSSKYEELLEQFNKYKSDAEFELEESKTKLNKYQHYSKQMLQKLEKKYETHLQQLRLNNAKKLNQIDEKYNIIKESEQSIFDEKQRIISELTKSIEQIQNEKLQIIEENKSILYDLGEDQEKSESNQKNTYHELLKLYQYAIEENRVLKRELYESKLTENLSSCDEESWIDKPFLPIPKKQIKNKQIKQKTKSEISRVKNSRSKD